jgi:hypothetical protein
VSSKAGRLHQLRGRGEVPGAQDLIGHGRDGDTEGAAAEVVPLLLSVAVLVLRLLTV